MVENRFADQLIKWFQKEKRWMPWRETKDPYNIWISEIMLQQTRVDTVIDYYRRFMEKFPTIEVLAQSQQDDVLKCWEGLGYYSRGRNLHRAANEIVELYDGRIPNDKKSLLKLPGIGPYTAGAILSIAYGQREPAVDGNVLRVMSRIFNINEDIMERKTVKRVTDIVQRLMPNQNAGDFTEALMELGATICIPKGAKCDSCPLQEQCQASCLEIQEELPIRIKKTKVQNYHKGVIWVEYNDAILVKQNSEKGLLGGLWVLPTVDISTEVELTECKGIQNILQEEVGAAIEKFQYVGDEKHIFTHQKWKIAIYRGTVKDNLTVKKPYDWVSIQQLEALTLPIVYRKVIDKINRY